MNPATLEAIDRARAAIAARQPLPTTFGTKLLEERTQAARNLGESLILNSKQQQACNLALSGKSFCLIGSAGTGKTTTLRIMIKQLMASNKIPPLEAGTRYLAKDRPGVVLLAYTRRAVRNIAKQMPEDFKPHCITYHKLVEYQPETVEVDMPDGKVRVTKPFLPQRKPSNPLPANLRLVIVDEASMLSVDFYKILCRALPSFENVQFIFLGDINQLPPVYGDGILGMKLNQLPTIELTEVYRQALESPIIEIALAIKDNKIPPELRVLTTDWIKETSRGKVTLRPWKKKLTLEDAEQAIHTELTKWVMEDKFNVEEDVILCPWGKSFGTINMSKSVATALARKHGRDVYEIISGFNKHYLAIGDRVMVDKRDAEVIKFARNVRYIGRQPQPPSAKMDYWGWGSDASAALTDSMEDMDALLDAFADSTTEDRVQEASHAVTVRYLDDQQEEVLTKATQFNTTDLAYAMSVHKSQGSEWRRVFLITHDVHTKMLQRELIYTAMTRASEELYVVMPPTMLTKAAARPKIKGDTLEQKLKFFAQKHEENDIEDYEDH